jgi:hypothetical protein
LTTGFSGTNDSKRLLPLSISFFGLPELESTNGELIANILSKENSNYLVLEKGITSKEIIQKITNISNVYADKIDS